MFFRLRLGGIVAHVSDLRGTFQQLYARASADTHQKFQPGKMKYVFEDRRLPAVTSHYRAMRPR
jgi:hypothetical protein